MSQCIEMVCVFPVLCRKWVRALTDIWATSSENLNLGLRCFVCFQKVMKSGNQDLLIWVLRRIYVGYFQHCGQVTFRTLEHINFMSNCFCELTKISPDRAYYVLFGYVRALAVQMQALNNSKGKEKKQLVCKLYSQQMLQVLKLLAQAVGTGEELSALVYPFAELINSYEKISESIEYLPLKLHLLHIELQLMENTGLYLPHALESIIKILSSSPLQRKHSKKAGVEGSIELGYKLSLLELKNTNILNDLFNKTVFHLHWLVALSYKMVGAVELTRSISKLVNSIEFGFSGHKRAIKLITKII